VNLKLFIILLFRNNESPPICPRCKEEADSFVLEADSHLIGIQVCNDVYLIFKISFKKTSVDRWCE